MQCEINKCNSYDLLKVLSGRYVAYILIDLYEKDQGYNSLKNHFNYLSNTQLTRVLKKCHLANLITKNNNNQYALTSYGHKVTQHLIALEKL